MSAGVARPGPLAAITAEDLAGAIRELLTIKYDDPRSRHLRHRLARGAAGTTVTIEIAPLAPIACTLHRATFTVTVGAPAHADVAIVIPMDALVTLLRLRVPLRALLARHVRCRGSLLTLARLARLAYVDVGDPRAAYAYVRHYFLDT